MPDNTGGKFNLTDVSTKDKPWDVHRAEASAVQALYEKSDFERYAKRIYQCSRRLDFALRAAEDGEEKLKLFAAKFCRVRHCPVCQWRLSLMWKAKLYQAMPKIEAAYPKARWVFLTLTVKNPEMRELRETIGHMNKSFVRLTQRKNWPADGWLKAMEVTAVFDCYHNSKFIGRHGSTWVKKWEADHKGQVLELKLTDEVHPHFHVLMMVKPSYFRGQSYLSQDKWQILWQSCLRADYLPVVNIKTVKSLKKKSGDEASAMAGAIQETLKYSVKPSDLVADSEWLAELTTQLHKLRSISPGGVMKNFLNEDEPEDLINTDIEDEEEELTDTGKNLRFVWRDGSKRYTEE